MHPVQLALWIIGVIGALFLLSRLILYGMKLLLLTTMEDIEPADPALRDLLRMVDGEDATEMDVEFQWVRTRCDACFARLTVLAVCIYAFLVACL